MGLQLQSSISVLVLLALLLSSSNSFKAFAQASGYGLATYYEAPYTPSNCYGSNDQGDMVAQVGDQLWNDGSACGQTYQVTCLSSCKEKTTVTVKIVDRCMCGYDFVLSKEAYDKISYTNGAGSMSISYKQVN